MFRKWWRVLGMRVVDEGSRVVVSAGGRGSVRTYRVGQLGVDIREVGVRRRAEQTDDLLRMHTGIR